MTTFPETPSFEVSRLEYHRPDTLAAALALLNRKVPETRPLAGGTGRHVAGLSSHQARAVVDLSALGLEGIARRGQVWRAGAMTTLASLASAPELPGSLREAATRQASRIIRQRATLGGVVASRDAGPLLTALLALGAQIAIEPGGESLSLEAYLAGHDVAGGRGPHLIVAVDIPVTRDCALAEISRTPDDAPILVVAVGVDRTGGAMRHFVVAAGGAGQRAVILHGASLLLEGNPQASAQEFAAAADEVPWRTDTRGSREYRMAMTPVLLHRVVAELQGREVSHAD